MSEDIEIIQKPESVGYKGVSYPFRINAKGQIATSTTGDNIFDHIEESVHQIWACNQYEREMRPEFYGGLDRLPFEPQPELTNEHGGAVPPETSLVNHVLHKAVERWDSRVRIALLQILAVENNTLKIKVEMEYTLTKQIVEREITLVR